MGGGVVTRRRGSRGPKRCMTCKRPIILLLSPFVAGKWRTFDPEPVNGRLHTGGRAYPTEGSRTYRYADFVIELLARHQYSRAEAEDEAYDVPWHVLHLCRESEPLPERGTNQ